MILVPRFLQGCQRSEESLSSAEVSRIPLNSFQFSVVCEESLRVQLAGGSELTKKSRETSAKKKHAQTPNKPGGGKSKLSNVTKWQGL